MDYSFSQALTKIIQCLTLDTSFQSMDTTDKVKTLNQKKASKMPKRVQYHRKTKKRIKALRPKVKYPPFTQLEDRRILELVLELGPKFQEIHQLIPNRTLSLVKNRYYKYLRYNWNSVLGNEYSKFNSKEFAQDYHLKFELENAGFQYECQEIISSFIQKLSSFSSEI